MVIVMELFPHKKWVHYSQYPHTCHTDGSAHKLGVGTGLFIQTKNDADGIVDSEKEISIHHSSDTTIFQAELSGISVAADRKSVV